LLTALNPNNKTFVVEEKSCLSKLMKYGKKLTVYIGEGSADAVIKTSESNMTPEDFCGSKSCTLKFPEFAKIAKEKNLTFFEDKGACYSPREKKEFLKTLKSVKTKAEFTVAFRKKEEMFEDLKVLKLLAFAGSVGISFEPKQKKFSFSKNEQKVEEEKLEVFIEKVAELFGKKPKGKMTLQGNVTIARSALEKFFGKRITWRKGKTRNLEEIFLAQQKLKVSPESRTVRWKSKFCQEEVFLEDLFAMGEHNVEEVLENPKRVLVVVKEKIEESSEL